MFKKSMLLVLAFTAMIWAEKSNIHHEINATVDPATQFLQATDKITIPASQVTPIIYFLLNSNLKIESQTDGVSLKLDETKIKGKDFGMDREDFELSSSITQNKYALKFDKEISGDAIFTLKFSGKIHNPVKVPYKVNKRVTKYRTTICYIVIYWSTSFKIGRAHV